jgi:hypothetical protein
MTEVGKMKAKALTKSAGRAKRQRRLRGLEALESRVLLSGSLLYVNDNWVVTQDAAPAGLSVGDTVDNSGDDGALHGLVMGTNAFDTLAGALTAATAGDRIVLVSGTYGESAAITKGVSVEGWGYFAQASALPAANPDAAHVNQSALKATLVTQISGAQWSVNDTTVGDSVTVRGMAFSGIADTGTIWSAGTNRASLAVLGNTFTDNGTTGTAVRIDAGSTALPIDIAGNVFTGVSRDVAAQSVTGVITGNSASGAVTAIAVSGGVNLSIANNTVATLLAQTTLLKLGIVVDAAGAGVEVTGNQLELSYAMGIVVSNTGANTVAVTGNALLQMESWGEVGILVTSKGADLGFTSGPAAVVVSGNDLALDASVLLAQVDGIFLDGLLGDAVTATVSGNTLNGMTKGIYARGPVQAVVSGNDVAGCWESGIGITAGSSALITGNAVSDSALGIAYNSVAPGTIGGTRFDLGSPNYTDIQITEGGQLAFAGGDHFGAVYYFVDNESNDNFWLAGEDFGTSDAGVIDDMILDKLDDPSLGLVSWVLAGEVTGEHVFYKGSALEIAGGIGAAMANKSALTAGNKAQFSNYTSYDRGLNGILVDFSGTVSGLSKSDFVFKVGNDNSPGAWKLVTAVPTITPLTPAGGTTQVEIVFEDGAIKNTWLEVTVLAGAHTDLLAPVTFYFGNAVGESGNSAVSARVNVIDELAARRGLTLTAEVTHPLDFNRDGKVSAEDEDIARRNVTWAGNELRLITPV